MNAPSQKSIEWIVGDEDAIQELDNTADHQEGKESVDEFESIRCLLIVSFPERIESICRLFWRR